MQCVNNNRSNCFKITIFSRELINRICREHIYSHQQSVSQLFSMARRPIASSWGKNSTALISVIDPTPKLSSNCRENGNFNVLNTKYVSSQQSSIHSWKVMWRSYCFLKLPFYTECSIGYIYILYIRFNILLDEGLLKYE